MMFRRQLTGFTLIEVMAVVLIIGIMATIVPVVMVRILAVERLNTGSRQLAGFITMLQAECVINARAMRLTYDVDNQTYSVAWAGIDAADAGDLTETLPPADLPRGVQFRDIALSDYDVSRSGTAEVWFQKDGWVTPHLVHLSVEDAGGEVTVRTLEVMPLTGQVKIYEDEIDWGDLR